MMAGEIKIGAVEPSVLQRFFDQHPNSVSFYCDFAQIINTGNEIVLQFYESIPDPPTQKGTIDSIKTRLRATITINVKHAKNIGKLLIEKSEIYREKK
jgi:hypothetical protein